MLGFKHAHLDAALVATILLNLLIAPGSCYYNASKFKKMVLHDHSNDDAVDMTTEQLITRSGFRYNEYYSVADDGYITQILQLINPKADRKYLKKPPVLMLHGSHLDSSIYIVSSSIQHHPEPWPRKPSDGPMTSSNRSLAFTLANNGYDVWLLGNRGSNPHNSYWTSDVKRAQAQMPNFKPTKLMRSLSWLPQFWNYGLDDIIKNELHRQIDLVRNLTGSKEYHYFSFSLSTITTMTFLSENPEYAKYCRSYTQMAPVVAASHFSQLARVYWEKLVPLLSNHGIGFTPSYFLDDFILKRIVKLAAKFDFLRYSLLQEANRILFGPSPIYQTNLERNLISHIIQPVSFKSAQQYGQSSKAQKFNYYDYGWFKNMFFYNKTNPPQHKVDRLEVQNYLIISGSLDSLADALTIQRLKELTSTPKPVTHIIAPGFNHIDLIAGVESDIYVNRPFCEFLDQHSDMPRMDLVSKLFSTPTNKPAPKSPPASPSGSISLSASASASATQSASGSAQGTASANLALNNPGPPPTG